MALKNSSANNRASSNSIYLTESTNTKGINTEASIITTDLAVIPLDEKANAIIRSTRRARVGSNRAATDARNPEIKKWRSLCFEVVLKYRDQSIRSDETEVPVKYREDGEISTKSKYIRGRRNLFLPVERLLSPIAYNDTALHKRKIVEIYIDHLSRIVLISKKEISAGIQSSSTFK